MTVILGIAALLATGGWVLTAVKLNRTAKECANHKEKIDNLENQLFWAEPKFIFEPRIRTVKKQGDWVKRTEKVWTEKVDGMNTRNRLAGREPYGKEWRYLIIKNYKGAPYLIRHAGNKGISVTADTPDSNWEFFTWDQVKDQFPDIIVGNQNDGEVVEIDKKDLADLIKSRDRMMKAYAEINDLEAPESLEERLKQNT